MFVLERYDVDVYTYTLESEIGGIIKNDSVVLQEII